MIPKLNGREKIQAHLISNKVNEIIEIITDLKVESNSSREAIKRRPKKTMTFKEVGNELPEQWKFENEGDFIQGIYAKKKTDVGKNKANLYIFEVEGKLKAVWGSTVLDNAMDDPQIEIGDTVRITYEGENVKPKYHKFKVEKDFPDEDIPDAVEDAAEEAEQEAD